MNGTMDYRTAPSGWEYVARITGVWQRRRYPKVGVSEELTLQRVASPGGIVEYEHIPKHDWALVEQLAKEGWP